MTRSIEMLMKFVTNLTKSDKPFVSEEVKQAATAVRNEAIKLRSESAIVYIGVDGDATTGDAIKYFGTKEAASVWCKEHENYTYRTEDLLF